jgi:Domain of unknown function (DUF6379)
MFDKYMILEHGFKNTLKDNAVIGFEFGARLPYYRGLGISMIEEINVTVDGMAIPREAIRVTLHGNTYSLAEMELEFEDRWGFGEVGTITVLQAGGLEAGTHNIELRDSLRISYFPFPMIGRDAKSLMLEP